MTCIIESNSAPVCRQGAFTLIELLVVLGIISLLLGMLLPTLGRAREEARAVACGVNLRQWGVACSLYTQQNNGYLPRRGQGVMPTTQLNRDADWFNALPPLMNQPTLWSAVQDGTWPTLVRHTPWACPSGDAPGVSPCFYYGMNMRLSTWFTPNPTNVNTISDPMRQVFMSEGSLQFGSVLPSSSDYSPVARHAGTVNISFLDGHVERFNGKLAGCGVGDPNLSEVRWKVPGDPWPGPS